MLYTQPKESLKLSKFNPVADNKSKVVYMVEFDLEGAENVVRKHDEENAAISNFSNLA